MANLCFRARAGRSTRGPDHAVAFRADLRTWRSTAADAVSKRAADRIRALQKESDALASQERTLLAELRKLEVDRELKSEELASAERELRRTREASGRDQRAGGRAEEQR